ncbi:MAG: hypothetical protein SGI73_01490 [Chloroflexota bacterium]|nr:hypothetical protein [Chloroflexota bacterium]
MLSVLALCLLSSTIHAAPRGVLTASDGFPLPPREPITPNNAARIEPLARLGDGVIRDVAWSPDGNTLAVASSIGVWLYDVGDLDAPGRLFEGQDGAESVAFNPNGQYIASGGTNGSVVIWDIAAGAARALLPEPHLYGVIALVFNADGSRLASGDRSGVARLWEMERFSLIDVRQIDQPITGFTFAPDDATAFPELVLTPVAAPTAEHGAWCAEMAADGALIVSAAGAEARRIGAFNAGWTSVTLAGAFILSGADRLVQLWLTNTGTPAQRFAEPAVASRVAVWGGDAARGAVIAHATDAGNVDLYSDSMDAPLSTLHGARRAMQGIAFDADGRLLAGGSLDWNIYLWTMGDDLERDSSVPITGLSGHTSGVTDVAFNADGTLLASSSYDGTIRLWGVKRADSGQRLS